MLVTMFSLSDFLKDVVGDSKREGQGRCGGARGGGGDLRGMRQLFSRSRKRSR